MGNQWIFFTACEERGNHEGWAFMYSISNNGPIHIYKPWLASEKGIHSSSGPVVLPRAKPWFGFPLRQNPKPWDVSPKLQPVNQET